MAATAACAYCRQRPTVPRYRPFCSERCRMADLGRWLRGDYRIPGAPAGDPPGSPAPPDRPEGPDEAMEP